MSRMRFFILVLFCFVLLIGFSNCSQTGPIGTFGSIDHTVTGNPFQSVAALPQVFLDTYYPALPPNHKVLTVGESGMQFTDCQPAIDSASPGDEVVIDAGYVCSPIILRYKANLNSYFIVIRTANLAQLPPQGTRISRSDPNLAIIETANDAPAVQTETSSNFYYLAGLEMRLAASYTGINLGLVSIGTGSETTLDQLPHDIVFARTWIHASPLQEEKRGITLNSQRTSLVDSIIEEIHRHNQVAQAVAGWNTGAGPFKIVNNELVSAGSNFSTGGATVGIQGLIPSDVEFRENYVHKLIAWEQPVTSYAGLSGPWVMDSFITITNGQRFLFDGNTFEDNWAQILTNFGSEGMAFILAPSGSGNYGAPPIDQAWVRVQDMTITNNVIRHLANGFDILFQDPNDSSVISQRLYIANNVMYDVGPSWGFGFGLIRVRLNGVGPVMFDHNTFLGVQGNGPALLDAPGGVCNNMTITNNIFNDEGSGVSGTNGNGAAALNSQFPGVLFSNNVLAGQNPALYSGYSSVNFFPANMSAVGFLVDPTSGVISLDNLSLAPTSPYKGKALDGADVGANIGNINQAM